MRGRGLKCKNKVYHRMYQVDAHHEGTWIKIILLTHPTYFYSASPMKNNEL